MKKVFFKVKRNQPEKTCIGKHTHKKIQQKVLLESLNSFPLKHVFMPASLSKRPNFLQYVFAVEDCSLSGQRFLLLSYIARQHKLLSGLCLKLDILLLQSQQ